MRVMIISKALVVGIYQRKLEHIADQGIDLLTVVPPAWRDERGEMPLEQTYTDGYELRVLPLRFNGSFHLHHYKGLARIMRGFRPHIVHIDEEPYNLAAWQALRLAQQAGARTLFFSWQNIRRDYPLPFSRGERWVLKNVDYALVGTESAGAVWREKGYVGPMRTVPQFGTDPELFYPRDKGAQQAEPFTIGFVGRLVEEKGVQVLLAACAQLEGDWQLRLLGGGPYAETLAAQTQQLGIADRVHFDGQIRSTQMPDYYHELDVLVLPSLTRLNWKEQFGRVLVEAMSSGIPVIGSDSGAIPDVIGEAGVVVPEGDADALAEALSPLMNDYSLRAYLGMLGRARVLASFTHRSIARQTTAVYREMMNEGRRTRSQRHEK